MDNTLFDFDSAALQDIPEERRRERRHFYIAEDYNDDPEMKNLIQETMNAKDFFSSLKPLPGVIEAMHAIASDGNRNMILTSPLRSNLWCQQGKRDSIEEHLVPEFGYKILEDTIIYSRKWDHAGVALIDDKSNVARGPAGGKEVATWEHVRFGKPLMAEELSRAAFELLDWSNPACAVIITRTIKGRQPS